MPQKILARSQRYYRRALYGSAGLLSIAIIASTSLSALYVVRQFNSRQIDLFDQKSEQIQLQAERLTDRLSQFVDLYEGVWWLRGGDVVPLERYRQMLAQHQGAAVSSTDLTATPFSIVTSLTGTNDAVELAAMLRIVRDISAAPSIDARKGGITLFGFLYSSDARFIATAPPLQDSEMKRARRVGAQALIAPMIAPFEPLLREKPATELRKMRPLWMSTESDGHTAGTVARVVLPIFHGDRRIATIAMSLPEAEFFHYFLGDQRPRGFFVLGQYRRPVIDALLTRESDSKLLAAVNANSARLALVSSAVTVFRSGAMLFVARRIVGPNWLAVYVIDWHDVLDALRTEFVVGTLAFLATLCLLWASVIFFDRRIGRPLQRDAMKLIEAEQFSQSIIDTLPVGVAVYIPDEQTVLLENAIAARMLGNRGPAQRIPFYRQIVRERAHVGAQINASFTQHARHAFVEAQWELEQGLQTHIGVALSETRFAGRDVLLLGLVDINERKANELLLHEAKAAADRANQAKSMFLAVMSHEIRTPLHGAVGNLELLAHTSLNAEQRERVSMIRRAFNSLLAIVNDILDVTKIEAHALKVNPAPVILNKVVEHCAQNFAAIILQRDLAFWCDTDPSLDLQVEADEQRVAQIIQNLLSNASKFTETGHITLSSKLLRRVDGCLWARIEIADSGIGIPAALQSSLFKPLAQADDTISRRFGGTGLGLFLCRNLAGLMNGRMTLASEPGIGSVFAVELPCEVVQVPSVPMNQLLAGLTVEVICEMPGWHHTLVARVKGWGAALLPQGISTEVARTVPHVRLVAEVAGGFTLPDDVLEAIIGVVVSTPSGPLQPSRQGNRVDVTSLSVDSLLSALRSFTDSKSPENNIAHPEIEATTEAVWQPDILVAEDEPLSRMLIAHQLESLGYNRVRQAQDGREALQMWLDRPADVTITDISMPELDGIRLLGKIREQNPHALVVATTASGSSDTPAAEAGFSHVMHKPVSLADLQRALKSLNHPTAPVSKATPDMVESESLFSIDSALREAFAQSWKDERTVIQKALSELQRERLRRRLHRLRGALLTIGADTVAADCSALESICTTAPWTNLHRQSQELIAKLDAMVL